MKSRYCIPGILFFVMTTSAVAQSPAYLNFNVDGDGNGSISTSATKCTTCTNSSEIKDGNVSNSISTFLRSWTPSASATLSLESDLDLGELNADGSCSVNHTPLTLPANVKKFNGNGKTISNMCYSVDVSSASKMNAPVGFFANLSSVEVSDVKFSNVQISLKTSGKSAKNFRAAGTLAGMAKSSKVDGVTLDNVQVDGVMVGGLFGESYNTAIENVSGAVSVSSTSEITEGGVQGITTGFGYYAYVGGISGSAINTDFSNIHIDVNLDNAAASDSVVMGGLAGLYTLYQYAGENLVVQKVHVGSESNRGVITHGAYMGGLFGLIKKSESAAKILMDESSFIGDISNPVALKNFAMGGFVGFFNISDNALKISKGFSDANLKSAAYSDRKIYMGGFVGGMGDTNTGSGTDDMISLVDSKAKGSIAVVEEFGSTVSGFQIFVGGLVGNGGFAVDNSIISDTAYVDISVSLNESSSADSVFAGGLVGTAAIHGGIKAGLVVKNSVYAGSVSLDADAVHAYVSGGIGQFFKGEDGNFISFENVRVTGNPAVYASNLLTLKGAAAGKENRSIVGGVCAYCRTISSINNVEVKGGFDIDRKVNDSDTLFVGGIVGSVTSASTTIAFSLINSYHLGTVKFSDDIINMGMVKKGYLVGNIRMRNPGVPYAMKSNYHYGDDFDVLKDAIGFLDLAGSYPAWNEFNECVSGKVCWDIEYNVRNGKVTELTDLENGTFPDAYMKGYTLASHLNWAWVTSGEGTWSYDADLNEGFAFLKSMVPDVVVPSSSSSSSESVVVSSSSSSEPVVVPASSSSSELVVVPPSSSSSAPIVVPPSSSSSSLVAVISSSSDGISSDSNSVSSSSNSDSSSSSFEMSSSSSVVATVAWRMVSLKGLENEGIVPTTNDDIYWWDETASVGDYWQYRIYDAEKPIEATQGFWVNTADDLTVEEMGPVPENLQVVWAVDSAYSGWNMVANPYGWTIDISDIGIDADNICRYNVAKADYDSATELRPYEAVWVKTNVSDTLKFTAKAPKKAGAKAMAKASTSVDGWSIKAILTDKNGKQDARNVIGVSSDVVVSPEPPAAMGDHVSLSIVEGKRALAKSLKPETDVMEWTINLGASTSRDAFLKLEGVDQVRRSGKRVYVTIDDRTTEMKEGSSLKVALKKGGKTATVTVTAESMELLRNPLGKLHVARAGDMLDVRFDAGAVLAGKDLKVDIVGISGKVVATMEATTAAGSNAFEMPLPKRGVYMIRVRAGSQTASYRINVQ